MTDVDVHTIGGRLLRRLTRREQAQLSGAALALLVLVGRHLLSGAPFAGDSWQAGMFLLALGLVAHVAWLRHLAARNRLPELVLHSVALAPSVTDGPERMRRLLVDLHHHARRHPVVLMQSATRTENRDGDADALSDAPHYLFVVGIPRGIARAGQQALAAAFSGTGCLIKEIRADELPLYQLLFEQWRRELEVERPRAPR